jgi:hypothetical protein
VQVVSETASVAVNVWTGTAEEEIFQKVVLMPYFYLFCSRRDVSRGIFFIRFCPCRSQGSRTIITPRD